MKNKRATLEVIAPTVEEAIAKGLADLGLPEDAVEVDILDQGSRGLFGLGSRQARVRLAVKTFPSTHTDISLLEEEEHAATPTGAAPASQTGVQGSRLDTAYKEEPVEEEPAEDESMELLVARDTVTDLLERMKVNAEVSSRYGVVDEERGRAPILVDVRGDDLGILIGRRAEVLNALQYITSLIVSKEVGHSVSLVIDVEGYRSRREGQLRQLARRMAEQAVKTGRRQVLEPMPANERRIIHMELRDHGGVITESIGEEPRRKVTIIPKEQA